MDVVLLGLPHKVSAHKAPEIMKTGARIVDLSGDFRLRDPAVYAKYYGAEHPCPDELTKGTFVYGLPELNREAIQKAKYVASPGCFATTIELALLPLAKAGLLSGPVEIVGITGSSGSGIAPAAGTHHPTRANNLKTYKPLEHQHIPEVVQVLAGAGAKNLTLRFVPVSAPLSRGIFATCFAHVDEKMDGAAIKCSTPRPTRASPSRACPPSACPRSCRSRDELRRDRRAAGRRGRRQAAVACFADRQPHQGRRGPGDPVDEPDARPRRAARWKTWAGGRERLRRRRHQARGRGRHLAHMAAIAADVAEMRGRGERVVIVHGGGPQATELQKKLGQTPNIVAGRRITDAETLEVMKMVVAGKLNVDACSALLAAGSPVGLHGASALAVEAVKRPPRVVSGGGPNPIDFGHVGDVTRVNGKLIGLLTESGYVPVLACLGADAQGHVFNINADIVANRSPSRSTPRRSCS